MNILIDKDEFYPYYTLQPLKGFEEGYTPESMAWIRESAFRGVIEIPEDMYAQYVAVMNSFHELQDILDEHFQRNVLKVER
jgi:hypothetical protein